MFDDVDRTEIGRLRNDFLTDDRGRRIYWTPFGPARWVPSLEEEENLGRVKFRVLFVAMTVAMIGSFTLLMWWEEASSFIGVWIAMAFGVQALGAARYVRRWPAIPRSEFSYAGYIVGVHERRSLLSLWVAVVSRIIACAGIVAGLVWLVIDFQPRWSDLTTAKAIAVVGLALMLTLVRASIVLSTYRAWIVLRKRM